MDKALLTQKIAVRFAKTGPAIQHSHHDMIRFWERAVRRAGLPVRLTQGFNPRPRLVFPHALGLGVTSMHEEVEIELHARVALPETKARLEKGCRGVLEILGVVELPPSRKSGQIRESSYRLSGWPAGAAALLAAATLEIMARPEIVVTRGAPGEERRVDIRPFLKRLSFEADALTVRTTFSHAQTGSARPDEVARLLAEAAGTDWRDVGMEKTGMTVEYAGAR